MNNTQIFYDDFKEEDININLKKILYSLINREKLITFIFLFILGLFFVLTFILPKKYIVDADLYINKANNSNLFEFNPYMIEEMTSGSVASLMGNSGLTNELELIKSPLVIDNVIRENNIVYKKKFGFIPNKKEGEYLSTKAFLGKGKRLVFENKKGSNVISITYKSKDKDLAYAVVTSVINNYIALHKELNSKKAKSDKDLLEKEYYQAKTLLNNKMKTVSGLPSTAMTGAGNLSAMSAFSSSARRAMSNLQGQYVAGEKSQLAVKEEAEKVSQLASKLEWAKLVDEMSDSSKVIVLKEPKPLRDFEYSSPKLLINIILGIVFGILGAIFAVIYKEITDKKLAYTMLDDEIIYDIKKDFIDLKSILLSAKNEKIAFAMFEDLEVSIMKQLQNFNNISFVRADISDEFEREIARADEVIIIGKIKKTDAKLYKRVKQLIKLMNKKVIVEVLV